MNNPYHCLECAKAISQGIYDFSVDIYGYPLCLKHQVALNESGATPEAVTLYLALKSNKVPVELEFRNDKNTIDITAPGKFYIEVDGKHDHESEQALNDFFASVHTWKEKIPTFHVCNAHIQNTYQLEMIVERLTELCSEFKKSA